MSLREPLVGFSPRDGTEPHWRAAGYSRATLTSVGLASMSNTAEYFAPAAIRASFLFVVAVSVDVEGDAHVAEALADVGIDAQHPTDVNVGADLR